MRRKIDVAGKPSLIVNIRGAGFMLNADALIFRSALRVAIAFAFVMTAGTALIFALVYFQVTTLDETRVRAILVDEAAKGVNYADAELQRALELRLTRDLRRLDYVAIFERTRNPIVGNIQEMPPVPVDGEAHFLPAVRAPGDFNQLEPADLVARARPDGSVLVLGRSCSKPTPCAGACCRRSRPPWRR